MCLENSKISANVLIFQRIEQITEATLNLWSNLLAFSRTLCSIPSLKHLLWAKMKPASCGAITQHHSSIHFLPWARYPSLSFHSGAVGISPEVRFISQSALPMGFSTGDVSVLSGRESSCWLAVFLLICFSCWVSWVNVSDAPSPDMFFKQEVDGRGSQRQQELSKKRDKKGPCGRQTMKHWEGNRVGLEHVPRLRFGEYWSSARRPFPEIPKKKITKPRLRLEVKLTFALTNGRKTHETVCRFSAI